MIKTYMLHFVYPEFAAFAHFIPTLSQWIKVADTITLSGDFLQPGNQKVIQSINYVNIKALMCRNY